MKKPNYRFDIVQNTDEWDEERIRRIGASSATALLMEKKTSGYKELSDKLVEETITKTKSESKKWIGNSFTDRGHEFEPIARDDYELRNLQVVDIIGIIILDDWVMCSPDGLIGKDKLHQIKCPIFNTQRKYLKIVRENPSLSDNELLKKIDGGYYKQCQYELYVSDRKINVWTSFHPHLKPIDLDICRDEALINQIKLRIEEIKEEVLKEVELLKR